MIGDEAATGAPRELWQHAPRGEAHSRIRSACAQHQLHQESTRQRFSDMLTLYEGHGLVELGALIGGALGGGGSFNVVSRCGDTLAAHVLHNRVRPLFLTDAGSWEQQQQAQGMQRAVEAVFKGSLWGFLGQLVALHGIVLGAAGVFVRADVRSMRVRHHLVLPWQVYFSARETESGEPPRSMIMARPEPRAELLEEYGDDPEAREAIERAPRAPEDLTLGWELQDDHLSDLVMVRRAWSLPSGRVDRDDDAAWGYDAEGAEVEASHDGREVVAIDGATLSDRAYPFERFPVAWFRPWPKLRGFWGRGVAEQLVELQLEITRTMRRIAEILTLHARPIVVVWDQARINPQQFAASHYARFLRSKVPGPQAITYITPQSIPSELIAHLERMVVYADRIVGISEMSASAGKPAGVEAFKALQLLQDTESIRQTPVYQNWEALHVEVAELDVEAFRALEEHAQSEGQIFKVIWEGDRELAEIAWGEVDLGESRYRLTASPTNLLAKTPAARMQGVRDLMADGMVDRETALELLDFPDVAAATDQARSALRAVKAKISAAIDGDVERAVPSPYTDLRLLESTAVAVYQDLEARGATDAVLDRVRHVIEHARTLLAKPQPGAVAPAPPGPGGALAAPPPGGASPVAPVAA